MMKSYFTLERDYTPLIRERGESSLIFSTELSTKNNEKIRTMCYAFVNWANLHMELGS